MGATFVWPIRRPEILSPVPSSFLVVVEGAGPGTDRRSFAVWVGIEEGGAHLVAAGVGVERNGQVCLCERQYDLGKDGVDEGDKTICLIGRKVGKIDGHVLA